MWRDREVEDERRGTGWEVRRGRDEVRRGRDEVREG